jgi:photosystem II stability/assembly factor-like uncharacterized protein
LLDDFFFLGRQFGWVAVRKIDVDGSTRLWRTTDSGQTWQDLAGNAPAGYTERL